MPRSAKRKLSFSPRSAKRVRRTPSRGKRRRNRAAVSLVSSTNRPFPARIFMKMKYSDVITLTPGASGVASETVYRLNSVYDPYYAAGGHQAYGFDQVSALYQKYRVWKASWTLTATPNGTTNQYIYTIPVCNNTTVAGLNPSMVMEFPRVQYKPVSMNNPTVIRGRVNIPKMLGLSKAAYTTGEYDSLTTGNPSEAVHLNIGGFSNGGTGTVLGTIRVNYTVEFYDPILIGQS